MADFADEGSRASELDLAIAMNNHANKQRTGVRPYTGFCHYCKHEVAKPNRFCDEDCKDDQLYEEQRRKQTQQQ